MAEAIPARRTLLAFAQQHLSNTAISEQHHDENAKEFREGLFQNHPRLGPPQVAVLCRIMLLNDRSLRVQAQKRPGMVQAR